MFKLQLIFRAAQLLPKSKKAKKSSSTYTVNEDGETQKSKKRTKKSDAIPQFFINHVQSLGFHSKEVPFLYKNKDYWLEKNVNKKAHCTRCDYSFRSKI